MFCVFPQLRDVGRKFRHLHEGSKKEVEELKTETTELKKKLEEAQASSESASALPPPSTDDADKTKVGVVWINLCVDRSFCGISTSLGM